MLVRDMKNPRECMAEKQQWKHLQGLISAVQDVKHVLLDYKEVSSMDFRGTLPPSCPWEITIPLQPRTKSKFVPLYKQIPI